MGEFRITEGERLALYYLLDGRFTLPLISNGIKGSLQRKGWIRQYQHSTSCWELTEKGKTICRQLGLSK